VKAGQLLLRGCFEAVFAFGKSVLCSCWMMEKRGFAGCELEKDVEKVEMLK
jgi:hypothetical protein